MSRSRGHCSRCRSLLVSSATTSQTWRLKLATKTVLRIHRGGAERRNQAGREGLNRLQRPRAENTTACCADGGDNTLRGEENAASVSLTSARSHESTSPERRRTGPALLRGHTKVAYRKEVGAHDVIRTSHLMTCERNFCVRV